MNRIPRTGLASLCIAAALAACASPTPYQPAASASAGSAGYSSQQIEQNRYRVSFAGNTLTSRERVEDYLLYRAAELTLERGYDGFTIARRDTDKDVSAHATGYGPGRFGYWTPYWDYWGPGVGWRNWDPYFGDPFWADSVDVNTVQRYKATAEIVMFKGEKPAGNPSAFDARDVVDNLRSKIERPG